MWRTLQNQIPLLNSLGNYNRESFQGDLTAGLTTAIMLVPQAMAYAMLAGLEPIIGLYAATLPTAIYAFFGTSRMLAVGPVAMVSLLVAGGVAPLAGNDPVLYATYASLLMLLVGALQVGMGVFRVGFLVKFLAHPVIAGFTSAAALIIGFSQLKHLLGVPLARSHHIHSIALEAISQWHAVNGLTLLIGAGSIGALWGLKRFAPKLPRFLIVVVTSTAMVALFKLNLSGVAIVGAVPSGLPRFKMPLMDPAVLVDLLPTALTISLVGFMESIAVAQNFARGRDYKVDPGMELRALGLANLAGAFFLGYPVTGGFSRTAVNAQAGAKTGIAAIITAVTVALSLLVLTPAFYYLPMTVLAAIIITAVGGLVDIKEARHLWSSSRPDLALMAITFVATLTFGIETGVLLGVAASLLWFVAATSKPHVAVLGKIPGTTVYRNVLRHPRAEPSPRVLAFRMDGPLYFANTAFLKSTVEDLLGASETNTEAVILDASTIGNIDASGANSLLEIARDLDALKIQLYIAGLRGPVHDALKLAGLLEVLSSDHLVLGVHQAMEALGTAPQLPVLPTVNSTAV